MYVCSSVCPRVSWITRKKLCAILGEIFGKISLTWKRNNRLDYCFLGGAVNCKCSQGYIMNTFIRQKTNRKVKTVTQQQ